MRVKEREDSQTAVQFWLGKERVETEAEDQKSEECE